MKVEWADNSSLCCCEYFNIEQERSHILLCCCNCQDLDESFESLLTGQRVTNSRRSALMATIQDRIRIPWRGGAKQISADSLIPVFLVPLIIFISAFDSVLTILILILIPLFLNHAFLWFRSNHPRTKFFVIWAITSISVVAIIFEVKVISLLEILPEENIALGILMAMLVFCIYRLRISAARWQMNAHMQDIECCEMNTEEFCMTCKKKILDRMHHCSICQVCVPGRDCHFVWYDCCIGVGNNGTFILSLVLAIASLLYSSNLTLTTVCHPFTAFETVMLPDDCSEVFQQYDMALCFVTAIYSIIMAVYLLWTLIRHCLVVSIGITGQEWRQIPFSSKLLCGFTTHRPYNKGFFNNWFNLLCPNVRNRTSTFET